MHSRGVHYYFLFNFSLFLSLILVTIQPDSLDINLAIDIRYTQRGGKDFRTGSKF
jgi:hypothetical protein